MRGPSRVARAAVPGPVRSLPRPPSRQRDCGTLPCLRSGEVDITPEGNLVRHFDSSHAGDLPSELRQGAVPTTERILRASSRSCQRPLMRACALEAWAHLPQVVIDDRLAAIEPKRLDQLTDPDPMQRRIPTQKLVDGSSFDGRSGQRNLGGASERNAERTVLRAKPVRRINSLIETPRTKCSLRSSAHCSTSSTLLLPVSTTQSSQAHQHPGRLRHHPRAVNLNRRGRVSLPPAPTEALA